MRKATTEGKLDYTTVVLDVSDKKDIACIEKIRGIKNGFTSPKRLIKISRPCGSRLNESPNTHIAEADPQIQEFLQDLGPPILSLDNDINPRVLDCIDIKPSSPLTNHLQFEKIHREKKNVQEKWKLAQKAEIKQKHDLFL